MSGLALALNVLMVGHSLFGQDGPDMLQAALRAGTGAADTSVQSQIINGAPLRYNWDRSDSAEGVDARAVLPDGGITHLVLTEAIPLANHVQWSDTEVYAQAFFGLAVAANPQAKVYIQETWHSLKSGTGEAVEYDDKADIPWRQRLAQDLPIWEGIVDSIATGNRVGTASIALIPAGQAMARLHDRIKAGEVPGMRDISALFSDDIHLNDTGHYFVAMVQYATLTGRDPAGLPTDFSNRWGAPFDTPDADLARVLQRVAWEAVQAYQGAPITPATEVPVQDARETTAPAAPTGPPAATPLPGTAATDPVQALQGAAPGTNATAIGLAGIADWSVQQPFIDVMKTSRPWIGHRPGQFGGMELPELRAGGYLDADGWPLRMPPELGSIGTLILTDMPQAASSLAGGYRLSYDGTGVIEVSGRATGVRYGDGEVTFDYTPGPGHVDIRIQRIDADDPPRNITVVKTDNLERFEGGAIFNPDWTRRIGEFDALRFMDWGATNDSTLSHWADRPKPGDVTWAGGVPVEIMVALAHELEADAWFNIPHLADDDYVRRFAAYVKENLDPGLTAYAEFSNEVWNWQFAQARWADAQALARWNEKDKWVQYYALRAAEVARIWSEVYGPESAARLVNVISTQTGWLGLEVDILGAPLVVAEGLPAPARAFDAYAVTGYFGGILGVAEYAPLVHGWLEESLAAARAEAGAQGLTGAEAEAYIAVHRYDLADDIAARDLRDGAISGAEEASLNDLITRVWPYHAAVARSQGLDLIMYEGGSHVVGLGPQVEDAALTDFLIHLNYTPQMGALYTTLLEGWRAVGGQLFNVYSDVYNPTKWGAWGALRYLTDENPRWDALLAFQ